MREENILKNRVGMLSDEKKMKLKQMMLSKSKDSSQKMKTVATNQIQPRGNVDRIECSQLQKEFWYRWNLYKESTADNIAGYVKVVGNLDSEKMYQAFKKLVEHHESLQSIFCYTDEGIEVKLSSSDVDFKVIEQFKGVSEADIIGEMKKESNQTFDLSKGKLIRMRCFHTAEKEWYLLMVQHHIISDGASTNILIKEMLESMGVIRRSFTRVNDKNQIGFYDYIIHQEKLALGEADRQMAYWKKELVDCDMSINLLESTYKNSEDLTGGERVFFTIENDLKEKVIELGKKNRISPFAIYMSVLRCMLYMYTKQEDTVIVIPVQGRNEEAVEQLVGCFLNMLPIRNTIQESNSFIDCAKEENKKILKALEHQDIPFGTILKNLNIRSGGVDSSVYNVVFSYEGNAMKNIETDQYQVSFSELALGNTKADLVLEINQEEDGLSGWFEYRTGKFSKQQIQFFTDSFLKTIYQITQQETKQIKDISFITAKEKELIIKYGTDNHKEWKLQTINKMFTEMVEKYPDKEALMDIHDSMTYRELNERSNCLAHYLREMGVDNEKIVAVMMEKSKEYFVSVLAIVKAGGAFLPIEPSYPHERIQFLLEDSNAEYLIYDEYPDNMDFINNVEIKQYKQFDFKTGDKSNLPEYNRLDTLAYVIYTSGTTGKPKGVMVEHHGVSNLARFFNDAYGVGENDRVLQFSHIVFDACVWEMAISLLVGGTLCIVTKQILLDVPELVRQVKQFKVTVVDFSPQYWKQICKTGLKFRVLLTAGSEADEAVVRAAESSEIYVNGYGPTENTVCIALWNWRKGDKLPKKIPIGKPMNNAQVYIVNGDELCGLGVMGEICVAGWSLARGYLNREELSAERFVDNPFGPGKLYHTGDYGRWMDNGDIEYAGRIDGQVKIRGYRVETGEIENCLCNLDEVDAAAIAIAKDTDGEKILDAYLVLNKDMTAKMLDGYLNSRLPFYMVPSKYYKVDAIPLTINSKTDFKALTEMGQLLESGYKFTPPRNNVERKLVQIWMEYLKVEKLGVDDSFFECGGDSIIILQIISKAKEEGIVIELKSFYEDKTIANIAANATITEEFQGGEESSNKYRISYPQKMILDKEEAGNENFCIKVELDKHIQMETVSDALNYLEEKYSILRTKICKVELEIGEKGKKHKILEVEKEENVLIENLMQQMKNEISRENGVLTVASLIHKENTDLILVLVNNLVCDSQSACYLREDIKAYLSNNIEQDGKASIPYQRWNQVYTKYLGTDESKYNQKKWEMIQGIELCKISEDVKDNCGELPNRCIYRTSLADAYAEDYRNNQFGEYKITSKELIVAALVKVLHKGKDGMVVIADTLRDFVIEDMDNAGIVGNFSFEYPFIFKEDMKNMDNDEFLKRIKNDFYEILKIKYDFLGYIEQSTGDKPDFNQAVVIDFENENDIEEKMASKSQLKLCVETGEGNVSFGWIYNSNRYTEDIISKIADEFMSFLKEFMDFCKNADSSGVTASDFDSNDVNEDELAFILSKFK